MAAASSSPYLHGPSSEHSWRVRQLWMRVKLWMVAKKPLTRASAFTVVSNAGKEAVIGILGPGNFLGEGCLAGRPLCLATAVAMTASSIVRLEKVAMIRVLHDAGVDLRLETQLAQQVARLQGDGADGVAGGEVGEELVDGAGHAMRSRTALSRRRSTAGQEYSLRT